MVMETDFDFVAYIWVLGILIVLVAVTGYVVIGGSLREHNRRREEAKANAASLNTWDAESPNSPNSFGHR